MPGEEMEKLVVFILPEPLAVIGYTDDMMEPIVPDMDGYFFQSRSTVFECVIHQVAQDPQQRQPVGHD